MAKRVSVDRWLFTVTMLLVFVGLVMVFSASAVMARERVGFPYAFLSKQLMWGAAAVPVLVFLGLIVLQPDLGTAIACAGIVACILYVAGMRMRYFAYAFGASLVPLYFLIFHVSFRRDRILAFLNPWADRQGAGFHIIQSLIAVSTGGITGSGLM